MTGTALGLLGSRVATASADTTPTTEGDTASATTEATTTTLPPQRPTSDDVPLLIFAEGFEIALRDLYQAAIDAGTEGDVVTALRDNHRGYADLVRGILGTAATGQRDDDFFDQYESQFKVADIKTLAAPGYEVESIAVATHTELLRQLQGVDGARRVASILIVEARHAAVLADIAGKSGDYDALFDNTATALALSIPGEG